MAAKRFSIAGVVFNEEAPAAEPAKTEKPKKKRATKAKTPAPAPATTEVVDEAETATEAEG